MTGVRIGRGGAALAFLLISIWPASAAATTLTLTGFTPTSGPVGTVVTLTGTGFAANDTFALFNGVPASPTHVATDGTSMKVAVPAFASSGPVTVESNSTGQTAGLPGAAFQVTPGVQLSVNHLYPGDPFVLTGSGFTAGQRDTIEIGTQRVGTALVGSNGGFQLGVSVPWDAAAGRRSLQVLDPSVGSVIASLFVLGDWEQAGHDAAGTRNDAYEPSLSTTTVSGLTQKWATPAFAPGADITAAGGMVFTAYGAHSGGGFSIIPGGVFAARVNDGSTPWAGSAGFAFDQVGTPVVSSGVVYMTTIFEDLEALDVKTGTLLWGANAGGGTSPTVAAGVIYIVGKAGGQLVAIDASNGSVLWTAGANLSPSSYPAVSATGTVVVGGSDGNLYAFSSTGAPLWTKPGGGGSSPAIVGNVVYMGSSNGTVYARHVTNGSLVWSVATGGPVYSPAVAGDVVYAPSQGGSLYAIQASTGTTNWSMPINPSSAPAVANGVIYLDETDGKVHALNAASGSDLWSATPGGGARTAPIVSNGRLFVGCVTSGLGESLVAYGL
jgi:outer membrane protein assembly factor BamB